MMRPQQHRGDVDERAPVTPLWRPRRPDGPAHLRLVQAREERLERRERGRLRSHARVEDLVHAVLVIALMVFIVLFAGSYSK